MVSLPDSTSPAPVTVTLPIDANRRLLNRYRFLEHEVMQVLAGWMPAVGHFETKCEVGRTIWECALHVNALYLRLREIQSPAFQRPDDAAFVRLAAELRHAPDEHALVRGIYRVVLPALIKALSDHETATFPNSDLPSVYAIKHALLDLRSQQERVLPLLTAAEAEGAGSSAATAWERYVQALLDASGGVSGTGPRAAAPNPPSERREFTPPREAARDDR
ncbi:MAG: hypothetical protein ACK5CF_11445, partial [Opitutaceae bacterium]